MRIFRFNNYRKFLDYYLKNLPKKGRGELKKLSDFINVSPTLLSQVLGNEKKHLSLEHAEGIARYLGLSEMESEYFILLVHLERAGTVYLKEFYEKRIEKLRLESLKISNRVSLAKELSEPQRAIFYSSYLYVAIWLFTSIGTKGKTIDEIERHFGQSRSKALEVTRFLIDTNLCKEDSGYIKMGAQNTYITKDSPFMLHHYRNWRIRSLEQSEKILEEELMYTAAVSLSKKDFKQLREEMVEFIQRFLKTTESSPADDIAYFNLDFLWLRPH